MGNWWKPLITSARIRRAQTNIDKLNQEYYDDLVLKGQSELFKKLCEDYKKFTHEMWCEECSNNTHEDDSCE